MNNHQKIFITVLFLTIILILPFGLKHLFQKGGAVKGEAVANRLITATPTPPLTGTTTLAPNPTASLLISAYTPAPVGNSAHTPTPTPTVRVTTTPATNPTGIFTTSTPVPTQKNAAYATVTPFPSWTPIPTWTPFPTWTPIPTTAPTSTPIPTPTSTPVPTPTPTFQQANGPRFITWTDSVGNTFTNSFNYYYQGWLQGMIASTAVSISAHPTMSFTVTANDPNGRTIQYKFMTSGSGGQIQGYSSNNSYTANVIGSPGTYFRVVASIKNDDAYVSYDSGGTQIDAEWFIDYSLVQ